MKNIDFEITFTIEHFRLNKIKPFIYDDDINVLVDIPDFIF